MQHYQQAQHLLNHDSLHANLLHTYPKQFDNNVHGKDDDQCINH